MSLQQYDPVKTKQAKPTQVICFIELNKSEVLFQDVIHRTIKNQRFLLLFPKSLQSSVYFMSIACLGNEMPRFGILKRHKWPGAWSGQQCLYSQTSQNLDWILEVQEVQAPP